MKKIEEATVKNGSCKTLNTKSESIHPGFDNHYLQSLKTNILHDGPLLTEVEGA